MPFRLRRAAKLVYRQFLALQAAPKLNALAKTSPSGQRLSAALRESFHQLLDTQERDWVRRIEAKRHALDRSEAPIMIIDYGAGDADEARTPEQMAQGVEQQVTVGQMSRISKYEIWVLMLHKLIRKFEPAVGIELGAAVGISAAYQASAMQLNGHGEFITLEGAPALAELTQKNLRELGLNNTRVVVGRFQDTLQDVLNQAAPIGHAFIDGHHDGAATLAYFEQIYPHLADRAVLIFDDIFYYASMRDAWNTLERDSRIHLAVDLQRMGVCVVDKTESQRAVFKIPMI